MKLRQVISFSFLSALSAACVPAFVEFYRPDAPGGKAVSRACGTINAPKTIWQYKMGDVTFEAIVVEHEHKKAPSELILRFFVPVGTEVSLQSKKVLIRTMSKPDGREFELRKMRLYRGTFRQEYERLESTEFKGGTDSEFGLYRGKEVFLFSARIETPVERELFVSVGRVAVNDRVYQAPEIRFVKEKTFAIYSINC